ncbi:drug/metabolite transporter (DMT)-like permease [Bacillus mesophilus]|uniref:DMT family transporter n=1 Tax=Bacillus mesophilus TaxID=1808955 RepID=A0A6M0QCC7_9BACI|nr:DMT family transporter [Bacillus mesophilus]MBM7663255.1 drug/metabolite transporter (DMT)-like permease [Bacillus mesophilus]NEY73907.1 DMT family transporter [Bacillus mesophilus]
MKTRLLADGILLFVAFIWGATFVLVQQAISFLEPFTFNAIRFSIAAIILMIGFFIYKRDQLQAINLKFLLAGLFIGMSLFLGYALQTMGLLYTTSSKAGFITGLSVVLVPLLSLLILKQRPRSIAIIGSIVAAFGLFMLTVGDTFSLNIGDLLVLGCAFAFAMHIILTGKYTNEFPTLLLTIGQILGVAVFSGICALLFEDWQRAFHVGTLVQREVLIALLVTSILATAFAFFAQTKLQQYTTPTRVALIFATEPVFAAITAYFWANERLGWIAVYGCVFIFIGMILSEWPTKKKSINPSIQSAS